MDQGSVQESNGHGSNSEDLLGSVEGDREKDFLGAIRPVKQTGDEIFRPGDLQSLGAAEPPS